MSGSAKRILLVADQGIVADVVVEVLVGAGHSVEQAEPGSVAGAWCGARHDVAIVADRALSLDELSADRARVIALTDQAGVAIVRTLVQAGATSVLTGDSTPSMLVAAVALTAEGASVLERSAASVILTEWRRSAGAQRSGATGSAADLTTRELEVLAALASGLATKAVARHLGVSVKTVDSHKSNLFKKLGVSTQAQAVAMALQAGLVEDETGAPGAQPGS